jgi:hypothetical protein
LAIVSLYLVYSHWITSNYPEFIKNNVFPCVTLYVKIAHHYKIIWKINNMNNLLLVLFSIIFVICLIIFFILLFVRIFIFYNTFIFSYICVCVNYSYILLGWIWLNLLMLFYYWAKLYTHCIIWWIPTIFLYMMQNLLFFLIYILKHTMCSKSVISNSIYTLVQEWLQLNVLFYILLRESNYHKHLSLNSQVFFRNFFSICRQILYYQHH